MTERPNALLAGLLGFSGAIALLLLVGIAAIAGNGFDVLAATVFAAFSACLLFLMGLQQLPLPAIIIVTLATASTVALIRSLIVAMREARLLRALPLLRIDDPELDGVARASGVKGVYSIPASQPTAFCVGILRPRVVLTEGLLACLDAEERAAVVWHEGAHARAHEPLKCLFARVAVRTFFWMPLLGELLDRYLLAKELDADRRATMNTSRRALAGALTEVAGQPTPAAAVGLAEFAAARVDRLFDPAAPLPRLFHARSIILTLGSAGALALALAFPATLGTIQSEQLWTMFSSDSFVHGLPGMLAGVTVNVVVLVFTARFVRLVAR